MPTKAEFNADKRTASADTAKNRFESWNKFAEAAGLEVAVIDTSKEGLIKQLQMLAKELGRVPTIKEFKADKRTASDDTARNRFESWSKFVEAAGFEVAVIDTSKEGLIRQLQMMTEELGRVPTKAEFNANKRTASASTAKNRFESWSKFVKAAGLKNS